MSFPKKIPEKAIITLSQKPETTTPQPKGMYTVDEEKGAGPLSGPLQAFLGREEEIGP